MTDETKNAGLEGLPTATTKTVEWHEEFPTTYLRFVKRDGKFILQCKWIVRTWIDQTEDWRDVPVESEE
jgi:hypothetical protein